LKDTRRLDLLLVERGLAASRERARALVLGGQVRVNGQPAPKAGATVPADAELAVQVPDHPYVSRGGVKLAHALDAFGIDVTGRLALDIGASTGGFTDVLLQKGAAKVFAVDVGTNQLAWSLRSDPRVVVHEQTNARYLTADIVTEPIDIIVCDASFIGLAKVLDTALDFAKPGGGLIALIKPQFEAERGEVGKGGVVRDPAVHERVIETVRNWVASRGWNVEKVTASPITGPEGNIEFLIAARRA
jgi:23S rRNA (cytidine1920-2'-O)/16S rRNA (cytidine1409-2'-O)-methyltransferase